MAIARTIVEAHGSRISAENQARGGAFFRLTLPVLAVEESP
jgi:K+-sensing histidine kinase KdpD